MAADDPVYGRDFPPSQHDLDWTSQLNVTPTTFVEGTPAVAVNVTAPTSGKVFVCLGAGVRNNAATNERVIVAYEIYEDTADGTRFLASSDDTGIKSCGITTSQEFTYLGNFSLVTGLTAGVNYFFRVTHRSVNGAGTADIAARDITVIPVP